MTAPSDRPGRDVESGALMKLGAYTLGRELGSGYLGVVHEARDAEDRVCVVKVLRDQLAHEPEVVEAFLREARAVERIRHPGIIAVYGTGTADGRTYIAMEHAAGEALDRMLHRGALPEARATAIARGVASALEAAHAEGVTHADLKPGAIHVDGDAVKIVDFGLARLPGDPPPSEMLFGNPMYLSPEQCMGGDLGPRSDIYALGCILHEMLAGTPPFSGAPTEMILHKAGTPPPRVAASPALAELVARMLAARPDDRPASMAAVVAALDACGRPPTRFDVVSAWLLLALPLVLLLYAVLIATRTSSP